MTDTGADGAGLWAEGETGGDVERRTTDLVNAIDDGVYQLDPAGRFVAVNDAIVETSGYAREELLGEHVSTVLDDEDVTRLTREIRARLEGTADPDAAFDVVVETAAGESVPCELRFSLLEEDGTFRGTAGVVRPVLDPDWASEQLPSVWGAEGSISSVINEADVGVFVLDDEFDVVWIDDSVEEYFGIDRSAVVGRHKPNLIEGTIRDRIADPDGFAETVEATYDRDGTVEQFECRITSGPDREERWLEHRSKPIESGRYAGGRIELYYDISDRKEAEQARQESDHRFQSLVDAVEEYAIFMLDTEGHVVSWNEGAQRIKGFSSEEIVGTHFSRFYTAEDRANGVPERNLERARTAGVAEDEGWRVRSDGGTFWANVTITAIREEGELLGFAKVTRDMTERREREQSLRRENELTKQILETSPVGIAVVRPDGTTERANSRMAELLDLPAEDSGGTYTGTQRAIYDADGEFLPVEDRPVSRVFATGEPISGREIRLKREDGPSRWLSINARPIVNDDGGIEQVVETATDITDLKELAERRKREVAERERELAAVRLATNLLETGDQPDQALLADLVDVIPRFFPNPEQAAARVSVGEHEALSDDYEALDRRIHASTRTVNGTPIAVDVALHDQPDPSPLEGPDALTEEEELIETLATLLKLHFDRREYIADLKESNDRLEQFAHAASHDLQEPLRMVSTYLQRIEDRYADALDEDGEAYLEYAVDGADRMREMIEGLLEYSRVESRGEPFEPTDLDAVIEAVREDLRLTLSECDAELTVGPLPTVEGDATQLRQVFLNLIDNAVEYSGDEPPRIHVAAERTGQDWTISVKDEGIGVDPEYTDQMFEVFQRLHTREEHPGTGIGLALCQRIVERHGGDIWAESSPDEGTTISFTLPAADE